MSPDGGAGAEPLQMGRVPRRGSGRSPCFTQSTPDRRARRAGRRSRRARRARASAGSASRAEPGEGENRYRRYALKRGFGGRVPRRGSGRSPCFTQSPPDRRARRAGRRSRRARRARASAGSASRAELGKGENLFEPNVGMSRKDKQIE